GFQVGLGMIQRTLFTREDGLLLVVVLLGQNTFIHEGLYAIRFNFCGVTLGSKCNNLRFGRAQLVGTYGLVNAEFFRRKTQALLSVVKARLGRSQVLCSG